MDGGEGFITTLLAIFFCVNKQKSVFGGSADIRKSRTASSGAGQLRERRRRALSATKVLRILCTQMGRRCAPPPSLEEAGAALGEREKGGQGESGTMRILEAPTPVDGPAAAAQRCWILGILLVVRYRNRLD